MRNSFLAWQNRLAKIKKHPFGPTKVFRNEEGNLHRDDGPSVITPTRCIWFKNGRKHGLDVDVFGNKQAFYENTFVPSHFIDNPEDITFDEIIKHHNAEVRRVGIKIYGLERMRAEKRFRVVHQDKKTGAELLSINVANDGNEDDNLQFVKVINSTPEPDGIYKVYFLCVPPTVKSCREAVAWTFGVETKEYAPTKET